MASVVALLLVPSAVIGANASIPGFESFFLFRIILLILSGITVRALFVNHDEARDFARALRDKPYLILPFIWSLYSAITILFAVDTARAIRYTVLLASGASHFYLLLFYFSSKEGVSRLFKAILVTFSLALVVAALEVAVSGFRLPVSNLLGATERSEMAVTSFFHNQNDFSTYAALTFPFLMWPLIEHTRRLALPTNLIFGLSVLAVLLSSFNSSKINFIALLLFAAATLFYMSAGAFWAGRQKFVPERQIIYGYLAIGFIFLLLPFPTLGPDLKHFASERFGGTGYATQIAMVKNELPGSPGERIQIMRNTFGVISQAGPGRYLSGVGAGNIEHYLSRFDNVHGHTNVHNWWLEIFANFGFLGILMVGLFLSYLIKDTFLLATASDDLFPKIALSSLLILLVVAVSPSSLTTQQFHWIIFGFAAVSLSAKTKLDKLEGL